MARASFILRKTDTDKGSYVAYPPSSDGTASAQGLTIRSSDDTYLRADDLQIAPILTTVIPGGNEWATAGYFTVDAIDYESVQIAWGVPLATTLTSVPQATQVVIVYSPQGEPSTISEGSVLVETSTSDGSYVHTTPSGEWAYYTLFVKYQSSLGDLYYEPAAYLSTLVPLSYGSSDSLYAKVPAYYRLQDDKLNQGNGGPLYRYLALVGWDVDKFRTLIDYFVSCHDPQIANSQALDLLANDLGIDLLSSELGAARLRALLNDVGTLRRSGGVTSTVTNALSAITGAVVTINGNNIRIAPQRINFITDPMLRSVGSNVDGGLPASTYSESIDGGQANTATFDPSGPYGSPVDGGSTPNPTYSEDGVWSSTINPIAVNEYIARTLSASVPVFTGDVFYFSVHNPKQSVVTKVALDYILSSTRVSIVEVNTSATYGSQKYWKLTVPDDFAATLPTVTAATASGSVGTLTFDAPHNITAGLIDTELSVTLSGFTPNWNGTFPVVSAPSPTTLTITLDSSPGNATAPYGTVTSPATLASVRFHYSAADDPTLNVAVGGNLLLEKNFVGSYFDGDSVRGGWVVGGPSISDFRWLGAENGSFSIYSENYQRTVHVVRRLLPSLLPVNRLITSGIAYSNRTPTVTQYTVVNNFIFGYSS